MKTLNFKGFSSGFSGSFWSDGAAANFGGETAIAAIFAISIASSSAGIIKNMMFHDWKNVGVLDFFFYCG